MALDISESDQSLATNEERVIAPFEKLQQELADGKISLSTLSRANREIRRKLLIGLEDTRNYSEYEERIVLLDEAASKYTQDHPEIAGQPSLLDTLYISENLAMGSDYIQGNIRRNKMIVKKEHTKLEWDKAIYTVSGKFFQVGKWGAVLGFIGMGGGTPLLIAGGVVFAGGWAVNKAAYELYHYRNRRLDELSDNL